MLFSSKARSAPHRLSTMSHSRSPSNSHSHPHSHSHGFHPFKGRVSRHFGESLSPEDAYLSYYDVRLTKEDVDCVKSDWLNDSVIAFYQEWLEKERIKAYPSSNISLLRPSMCFMLMQTPDPLTLKDALPSFRSTTHIFLPVNDNRDATRAEGGSHWSLLLVSTIDGVAFHYDSMRPSNHRPARIAADKLSVLLGKPLRMVEMEGSPQQENGSDCGVYVCLQMKYLLLHRLLQKDSTEKVDMGLAGYHVKAKDGRKDIASLIEGFRKEGMRSRSRSRSRNASGSRTPPRIGD